MDAKQAQARLNDDANRLAWGWMRLAMASLDPARDG